MKKISDKIIEVWWNLKWYFKYECKLIRKLNIQNPFKWLRYKLGLEKSWRTGYRTVLTCTKCGDSIHSPWSGAFVSCSCDAIFIDETPYYYRAGGNIGSFTVELERLYNEKK